MTNYCKCETPIIDVEHDAGCRRCGLPVNFDPYRVGAEIFCQIDGQPWTLTIDEHVPVDAAAFQNEPGFMCFYDPEGTDNDWFFVSQAGIVYKHDPSVEWRQEYTIACGTCPDLVEQAAQIEAAQAQAEIEAEKLEDEWLRGEIERSHTFDLLEREG